MALDINVGIELSVSVADVVLSSLRASGDGMSWVFPLALSMSMSRGEPNSLRDLLILEIALSRLLFVLPFESCSILRDLSNTSMTVSTVPAPQPKNPPTSGRAMAKMRAAMASVRQARMMRYFSFFLPRDSRVALSKNSMAAHCTVRCRLRLSRWIMIGMLAARSPQRSDCWRKDMNILVVCYLPFLDSLLVRKSWMIFS